MAVVETVDYVVVVDVDGEDDDENDGVEWCLLCAYSHVKATSLISSGFSGWPLISIYMLYLCKYHFCTDEK